MHAFLIYSKRRLVQNNRVQRVKIGKASCLRQQNTYKYIVIKIYSYNNLWNKRHMKNFLHFSLIFIPPMHTYLIFFLWKQLHTINCIKYEMKTFFEILISDLNKKTGDQFKSQSFVQNCESSFFEWNLGSKSCTIYI